MPPSAVQITIDQLQPPLLAFDRAFAPPVPLPGSHLLPSHPPGSITPSRPGELRLHSNGGP